MYRSTTHSQCHIPPPPPSTRFLVDTELRALTAIQDNNNGTYTVTLQPQVLGPLPIHVRVANAGSNTGGVAEDIVGSPVTVGVVPPTCHMSQSLGRDSTSCVCAPGYGLTASTPATCERCPPGTAKPTAGDAACTPCEAGKHSSASGALSCTVSGVVGRVNVDAVLTLCCRCCCHLSLTGMPKGDV